MRKSVVITTVALSILAIGTAAFAKTDKTLVARQAAGAVTIDGDLKEFLSPAPTGAEVGVIDTASCTLEAGTIDDNADWSGKFYALYDAKSLYLGFDITDETIAGSQAGGNIWQNDTLEIWFDADNDDVEGSDLTQDDEHQVGLTICTEDEPGAVGHNVWRSVQPDAIMENIVYAGKVTKTGWTMEAKINWADLMGTFTTVKPGQVIGLNLSIVDNDGGGFPDDWNHLTWAGTRHNDPQQFAALLIK